MNDRQSPLLEAQDLVTHFPVREGLLRREVARVHALDGVSLVLKPGQTLGLVGESGCGKSTLGRTLLKLTPANKGRILFAGQDITSFTPRQMRPLRRQMQMVFQDPFASLNPRMPILQILEEPLLIHGVYPYKKERIEFLHNLIKEVGLNEDAFSKYPHEFSGGQRQRVGIARALALRPQLIVCDEPVSALDVSIQGQILNLMVDLRTKYNLAYLFIAHDLAVVEHIAHEVAVMYLGKIVEQASVAELYQRPLHPYTQALLASIPKPSNVSKRLTSPLVGDIASPLAPPSGCRFRTRCPLAQPVCAQVEPEFRNANKNQGINDSVAKSEHYVACHFV